MDNPDELARMATERNGLYSLLATVFRDELTEDLFRYFLKVDFLQALAAVGLKADAVSSLKPDKTSLDELSLEFSRLFVGPGNHVSPYESVHLGGDGGALWGPETSAVKRFIEKSGFVFEGKHSSLPDHISVELEFMAHLTDLEATAWRRGDAEKALNCRRFQKEFLHRHLGRWAGSFSAKVADLADLPFYAEFAVLMRDFLDTEGRELAEINALKGLAN